ncbi:MAG: aromatic ring-hydroxylating dioxygenase subunit alpha [Myxococcota bacterium]|nr:aromatic ring-hydroxylating dioxygenase subunit alpha [Myxococcota bacterium]
MELHRAETLPASWYHDPAVWEAERRRVFGREWLLFAHESELAEPGACRGEVVAGWPVFARRGRDGVLRAFHDVCRHRAGPLVGEGARTCRVLRCRYHGWVYADDGRLERTPDFGAESAEGFEPGRLGLHPLSLETWRGFVFVNLDPQAPPLAPALGRLPALAAELPLEALRFSHRASHPIRCNWKAYVENYLEGYHVPCLHPSLHAEIDVKGYRVEAAERVVTHHAPTRPRVTAPIYDGLWAWLAPNVAFNCYGNGLSVERMLPDGPRAMRLEYLFFFRDDVMPAAREAALEMCRVVTREDAEICEPVQRNLEAGVHDRGRLSPRHENGVFWFQQWLRGALGTD